VTSSEFCPDLWYQESTFPGLLYDVVCTILSFVVLMKHRLAMHTQTDRQSDMVTVYTVLAKQCAVISYQSQMLTVCFLNLLHVTGFVQTLKCFFPGLAKTKFQGFPGLKNPLFQDFPGHVSFTNMGCMRSKKCIHKISYQCSCITVKKQKCNTWGCIILFNSIKVFLIFGLTQEVAYLFSDYSNQLKIPEPLVYNSRTFQAFPGTMPFSRTFQGLEFFTAKFQDFPGSVWTLM